MKVCLEQGCPTLTHNTRCTTHERAKDRSRGTRQERGYGADYERQLNSAEYLSATACANCGCAFTADNPKTGGHSIALRNGGGGSKIVAQCRRCNFGWLATDL